MIIKGLTIWVTSVIEPVGRISKCKGNLLSVGTDQSVLTLMVGSGADIIQEPVRWLYTRRNLLDFWIKDVLKINFFFFFYYLLTYFLHSVGLKISS